MGWIAPLLCAVMLPLLVWILLRLRRNNATAALEQQLRFLQESQHTDTFALRQLLADEFERSRRESGDVQEKMRAQLGESLRRTEEKLAQMTNANAEHQQKLTQAMTLSLESIRSNHAAQNEKQNTVIADSIARMQESNEKRLEQMRATVDEKLQATLSTRLDSSFKTVSEQLENVYKSLGEMKELSSGVTNNVTSLSRILTNVKARGTWAEVQLEGILDQTIPGMYERNFAADDSSRERVEFAIRIPVGEDKSKLTYLPVDSKFPVEDYIRLCDAADAANAEETQRARKALEDRVLTEAKRMQKYIQVPKTTPFAILYLATEGLYAEIAASRQGLPERLQRECSVMIAGPTTITALLNSLSMGFRAVAINEKANEMYQLLSAAKKQYGTFGDLLDKARRKIEDAGKSLGEAQHRNEIIQKRLKGVESMEGAQAEELLGIAGAAGDTTQE